MLSDLVRKALAIGLPDSATGSLKDALREIEVELVEAPDGSRGLKAFYAERPDLVLLDLGLTDAASFEVLGTLRELSDVPIFALAVDGGEEERVKALRAGADDCISRPASGQEVLARIEALLRRARSRPETAAVLDDEFIHIDHPRHRVEVLGIEVSLTPIEFRMLATFAENPGRVLGHDQLLDLVWGDRIRDKDEVKLYVSYLRRKLGEAADVDPVETVRGVGYRYRPRRTESGRSAPH
jgi:DNA-binding response OmpR family regulator